jgi:hypothetical protein
MRAAVCGLQASGPCACLWHLEGRPGAQSSCAGSLVGVIWASSMRLQKQPTALPHFWWLRLQRRVWEVLGTGASVARPFCGRRVLRSPARQLRAPGDVAPVSQLPEASVQSRVQLVKQLTSSCSQQLAEQQSSAQRARALHAVGQVSACATLWSLLCACLVGTGTGGGPDCTCHRAQR